MASPGPAPAFRSNREALAFLALMLAVLALPLVSSAAGWLRAERVWPSVPSSEGTACMSAMQHLVYEEEGDIDIAFVGSSLIHAGIDTPYLQERLSARLGRPAVVRTFGFTFAGDDVREVVIRELLARRRVHMLVIATTLPWGYAVPPHPWAKYWFDPIGDRALAAGADPALQVAYYGESVLGAPRRLLTLLRPDYPPPVAPAWLGAAFTARGRDGAPLSTTPMTPPTFRADELIHRWDASDEVEWMDPARVNLSVLPFERHLLSLTVERARASATRIVVLNIPYRHDASRLVEATNVSDVLGPDVPLVGIAPTRLFASLTDAERESLYFDRGGDWDGHFNVLGSRFFTQALAPAFLELYEQAAAHE